MTAKTDKGKGKSTRALLRAIPTLATLRVSRMGHPAKATANTEVLRYAQDDGKNKAKAKSKSKAKAKAKAKATANTEVLRYAQDDGKNKTKAKARALARYRARYPP